MSRTINEQIEITDAMLHDDCDLISRQDAIDAIEKTIKANQSIHYEMRYWEDGMNCAINIVDDMPSAERKRGEWILQDDKTQKHYGWHFCSECGAWIGEPTNFCSECGADTRGEKDE